MEEVLVHTYLKHNKYLTLVVWWTSALFFNSIIKWPTQDSRTLQKGLLHYTLINKDWNDNMKEKIILSSWMSWCINELMSWLWTHKWIYPGFMYYYVPTRNKPHPMGNEGYQLIACGLYGIMFAIKLVEGKDTPRRELKNSTIQFSEKRKDCSAGLFLRLCRGTIFSTAGGKVMLILDSSGFCVLQAIVELKKMGVSIPPLLWLRKEVIGQST